MEGITIPVNEKFKLPSGAEAMSPGQSGVAGEDINCRCFLSYSVRCELGKSIENSGVGVIIKTKALPRCKEVVIPEDKFKNYALNPDKAPDKAFAFKAALGYDMSNYKSLIENIRSHISEYDAKKKPDNGFGTRYEVVMNLTGANGKTAKVLTAWIDDKKTGEMRLTTVHVDK